MIRLRHGALIATVAPEVGGSVASLIHEGRPVLRPTPEGSTDPLAHACLPLVPFANRVRNGRFVFSRQEVVLDVLPAFSPHALHGQGWRAPWRVVEQAQDRVRLAFEGGGDAWPWPYKAQQTFTLSAAGLSLDLRVTNAGSEPMPSGLGLHPYFPSDGDATIEAETTGIWVGDDIVPDRLAAPEAVFDWTGRRAADAPFVDHCYEGWNGVARLSDVAGVTVVRGSTDRLHVCVPKGETFCCLEPVTHRPDVFNQASPGEQGFVVLQPGETQSMGMTIDRE